MNIKKHFYFFKEFIKSPKLIGAMTASSENLSDKITNIPELHSANCIVEFGPGTGPFTKKILEKKKPETLFFAIEKNENFRKNLDEKFPELPIYYDDAVNIDIYLKKHQINQCDVIISGLPWAFFSKNQQIQLVQKISDSLSETGCFVTFFYIQSKIMPSFCRFQKMLKQHFQISSSSSISKGRLPVFILYARKIKHELKK